MRQIFNIFLFTLKDGLKKKAFIISTAIMLILVLALCSIPSIIGIFDKKDSNQNGIDNANPPTFTHDKSKDCFFIDEKNLIPNALDNLEKTFLDTEFVKADLSNLDEYKNQIKDNNNASLIIVNENEGKPFIKVLTKDFMSGISPQQVTEILTQSYITSMLTNKGFDAETIAISQTKLGFAVEAAGDMDISGYAVGILLTMVIFFAIYYYGYGVAMSVATEKTSRVMETLIVSAKPSRILIGKCLGMGVLGLAQLSSILAFAVVGYKVLVPDDFLLFGMPLSFNAFNLKSASLIIIYFILGYTLYALMNSVCGASVSKIEDLNSAMMPVMMIAMASFYLGYFAAVTTSSDGLLQKIAMYVPFSSPFIMPFKLLNGNVSTTDILLSLVIMLVTIIIIAFISIKIYSASVLHYGKKLKINQLLKMKV